MNGLTPDFKRLCRSVYLGWILNGGGKAGAITVANKVYSQFAARYHDGSTEQLDIGDHVIPISSVISDLQVLSKHCYLANRLIVSGILRGFGFAKAA